MEALIEHDVYRSLSGIVAYLNNRVFVKKLVKINEKFRIIFLGGGHFVDTHTSYFFSDLEKAGDLK